VSFLIAWTPYAFVSFYTGFVDDETISPSASTIPAFIMKSSMVWSTIFFVLTNKNIQSKFHRRGENCNIRNDSIKNDLKNETFKLFPVK